MIETSETQTDTMITATIAAADCDGGKASIEVTASIGEFDGVIVESRAEGSYVLTELTLDQTDELIAVLMAARAHLTA